MRRPKTAFSISFVHQTRAHDIFDGFFQLGYNVASMGEFGFTNAEGAMPMNAQANGPSIFTLWRAAFSCPPKGLKEYKWFELFNLSGNRTGGHQFLQGVWMSAVPANLKRTILFDAHHLAGAKLVDFGGWEMPVNYGSQIEEHIATRTNCGVFDVSHMAAVDVIGKDAKGFLEKVVANNVNKLKNNGQALYGCLLNDEAGVIDDLIVYRLDPNYRLVINAATAHTDLEWLNKQATGFQDVKLIPRRSDLIANQNPQGMIAVQGPKALELIKKAIPSLASAASELKNFHASCEETPFGEIMIARTGYTGEDGAELLVPLNQTVAVWNLLIAQGAQPAGLGARDTLRLEAGMNLYGQDMNDQTNPLDVGLSWTIDRSGERDFIGKSALERKPQKFIFLGLILQDKGVLRAHQIVRSNKGEGEITSGTFSPSLQKSIALAKLPLATEIGETVKVVIRDKELNAVVVKPPFVRHGKALV
jgi:aminomethyltransferase